MPPPVRPPIEPMLARLVRELPTGPLTYEPKWDGFRCLAFVEADNVDLRSRHDRPLARYFPEVVAGLERIRDARRDDAREPGYVLDGEILLDAPDRGHDFAALMSRLHPAASRVERLSRETPARYVAFDLLADGASDLREAPFVDRRAALEQILPPTGIVAVTASTRDAAAAERWLETAGSGIDGVVAKPDDLAYRPGHRSMIKVKRQRTAECVVAGIRVYERGIVATLILGLYDDAGALRHVGVVTQLTKAARHALFDELVPDAIALEEHPWREGFAIGASPLGRLPGAAARWRPGMDHDWVPLRPQRVVEVAYDQVDGDRLRHPARLIRWRPDRPPESCRLEQILVTRSSAAVGVS
ncbi:MAG: ATP-dependent DNA ligase [Chloroflexota bacterium]